MDWHILSEATSVLRAMMLEDALLGSQVRMRNSQTGVARGNVFLLILGEILREIGSFFFHYPNPRKLSYLF